MALCTLAMTIAIGVPPTPADDRVLLDWALGVEELRVMDLEGQDMTERVQPREEQGRISLAVPQSRPLALKRQAIDTLRVATDERITLPDGLLIPSFIPDPEDTEIAPASSATTWLRLTLAASPVPVTWNP